MVPSVMWYLAEQVRFPNAWTHEICECKAIPSKGSKEDLTCILRVEGSFQVPSRRCARSGS